MKFNKILKDSFQKSSKLGIVTAGISFLATWIITTLNVPLFVFKNQFLDITASTVNVNIRDQILNQGLAPQIGQTFIDLLSKIPSFNPILFIQLFIGSYIIVFLGKIATNYLGDKISFFIQDKGMKKVSSQLLYGFLFTALIIGFVSGIGIISTIPALLLYYIIILTFILLIMKANKTFYKWVAE